MMRNTLKISANLLRYAIPFTFAESVIVEVDLICLPCHCWLCTRHIPQLLPIPILAYFTSYILVSSFPSPKYCVPSYWNSLFPTCLCLQHYRSDADGLCCRLRHAVWKTSGNIEYTVSQQDFKESKFNAVID